MKSNLSIELLDHEVATLEIINHTLKWEEEAHTKKMEVSRLWKC